MVRELGSEGNQKCSLCSDIRNCRRELVEIIQAGRIVAAMVSNAISNTSGPTESFGMERLDEERAGFRDPDYE